MCEAMALCIKEIAELPFEHLAPTFALVGPKADRKRPLGQAVLWKEHRQAASALKAVASGYQLKRGAMKPLLDIETEPGEAIAWALQIDPTSVQSRGSAGCGCAGGDRAGLG